MINQENLERYKHSLIKCVELDLRDKVISNIADKVCKTIGTLSEQVKTEILQISINNVIPQDKIQDINTEINVIVDEKMVELMKSISDFTKQVTFNT